MVELNPTGTILGGCELHQRIGAGGMATVYGAYQRTMHREVAIKIMRQELNESDTTFYARFVQEARTTAALEHLHILSVYDFGQESGYVYLIMRRMERSLADFLREKGTLTLDEVARILHQIADALDYAHSRGVIHRDLKPSNVLMDQQFNCYLSDFGLAYLVNGSKRMTADGRFVGTPAYVAPEQVRGAPATRATDIYSLGILLFEMVCGTVPFVGETPSAVIYQHLESAPPDPCTRRPDLPAAAADVILKALSKLPIERWKTSREMADSFGRSLEASVLAAPDRAKAPPRSVGTGETQNPTVIGMDDTTNAVGPSAPFSLKRFFQKIPGWGHPPFRAVGLALLLSLVGLALVLFHLLRDPAAPNRIGAAALAKLDYNTAIQQFQLALQYDPHYAPAYYNLGVAYEEMGNFKQAQDAYTQAIQYDSRLLLARYRSAELLLDAKSIDQGFQVIDLGIKIFQESDIPYPDAARQQLAFYLYATRGRAYLLRNASTADLALAEADLLRALTTKEAVDFAAPAYYSLAMLYELRGDMAKAKQAWLDTLASCDPNSERQRQWAETARQKLQNLQN